MKSKESWSFSAPLSQVDVPRIIRESRLATTPGRVVRFTIDDKTYTAWRERDFPGRVAAGPDDNYRWYAPSYGSRRPPFRREDGQIRIWNNHRDVEGTGIRIQSGDHLTALVDRVATTVEVF